MHPQRLRRNAQQYMEMPALIKRLKEYPPVAFVDNLVLLCAPSGRLCRLPALVPDDLAHVRAVVAQRNGHVFRFLQPVFPLQFDNPLLNHGRKFRKRNPAHPIDLQPVQFLPGLPAQLKPADRDIHPRLAVPVKSPLSPGGQSPFALFRLVCLGVSDHPVQVLVFAEIPAGNPQLVCPDGINPGIHSRPTHALFQGAQVSPAPHLAGRRVIPLPDMQHKRIHRQVVFPYSVRQSVRNGSQGIQHRLTAERIVIAHLVGKVPQCPVSLQRQHRRRGLLSRPRRDLIRNRRVVQNFNHVLQLNRSGFRVDGIPQILHAPDVPFPARPRIQQPVIKTDPRPVRPQLDCGGAFPLLHGHALAFRQKPFPRAQAVSNQLVHIS